MSVRYAAIDIGSNSTLLLIVESRRGRQARVLLDTKFATRLATGLKKGGEISETARRSLINSLCEIDQLLRIHNVDRVAACSTQAFRLAKNARAIVGDIAGLFGWKVEIISGTEEAALSYKAAVTGLSGIGTKRIVADIGGGSTEIILGEGETILNAGSIPVGAVSTAEQFGLQSVVSSSSLGAASRHVAGAFQELTFATAVDAPLVVVGGTAATLAALAQKQTHFDPARVHGRELTRDWILEQLDEMAGLSAEERRRLLAFDPSRAEVIIGGTVILAELLKKVSADKAVVSNRGLRWGLLLTRFPELLEIEIEHPPL